MPGLRYNPLCLWPSGTTCLLAYVHFSQAELPDKYCGEGTKGEMVGSIDSFVAFDLLVFSGTKMWWRCLLGGKLSLLFGQTLDRIDGRKQLLHIDVKALLISPKFLHAMAFHKVEASPRMR